MEIIASIVFLGLAIGVTMYLASKTAPKFPMQNDGPKPPVVKPPVVEPPPVQPRKPKPPEPKDLA